MRQTLRRTRMEPAAMNAYLKRFQPRLRQPLACFLSVVGLSFVVAGCGDSATKQDGPKPESKEQVAKGPTDKSTAKPTTPGTKTPDSQTKTTPAPEERPDPQPKSKPKVTPEPEQPVEPAPPPVVEAVPSYENDDTPATKRLVALGKGFQLYHDVHNHLPPAHSVDAQGKPLLSWRVHLLPYLGYDKKYQQFKLDEAWDGPTNKPLLDDMPGIYRSADQEGGSNTAFVVPVGKGLAFEGKEGLPLGRVRDGLGHTVLVVESDQLVPWSKPDDWNLDLEKTPQVTAPKKAGFATLFADGHVQAIKGSVSGDRLKALLTIAGEEPAELGGLK